MLYVQLDEAELECEQKVAMQQMRRSMTSTAFTGLEKSLKDLHSLMRNDPGEVRFAAVSLVPVCMTRRHRQPQSTMFAAESFSYMTHLIHTCTCTFAACLAVDCQLCAGCWVHGHGQGQQQQGAPLSLNVCTFHATQLHASINIFDDEM